MREMPDALKSRGESGDGTCDVGCGDGCARGVEEAGVVGRRSVHAGDETELDRRGGAIP